MSDTKETMQSIQEEIWAAEYQLGKISEDLADANASIESYTELAGNLERRRDRLFREIRDLRVKMATLPKGN